MAVLHVNDDYGNYYARGMRDNTLAAGVVVVTSISFTNGDATTYAPACASLAAAGVNIVVIVAWDQELAQVLTACRSAGPNSLDLMAAGYVWISADSATHEESYAIAREAVQSARRCASRVSMNRRCVRPTQA
jgi:ABC-type branched-subunit amino acid transport system substrate-binding protein